MRRVIMIISFVCGALLVGQGQASHANVLPTEPWPPASGSGEIVIDPGVVETTPIHQGILGN